jgi:hypothetical protein
MSAVVRLTLAVMLACGVAARVLTGSTARW